MFEGRIETHLASAIDADAMLGPLGITLVRLQLFTDADSRAFPAQNRHDANGLAERYAGADSITRRRFDALLKETELAATTGLTLLAARANKPGLGTAAAARFLGNRLDAMIRKLDALIATPTTA